MAIPVLPYCVILCLEHNDICKITSARREVDIVHLQVDLLHGLHLLNAMRSSYSR